MLITRYVNDVVVWAPAKVNLYLEVLAKRPDGYHELETLLVAVSLFDTLVFREVPTPELHLRCDVRDLSTGPDNLIVRAARLLQQHAPSARGADIRLVKRIPMAAGLAGGSTDAAATLAGLNALWGLGLPPSELAGLAAQLGSDIPFFFATPAAWCTGRGEQTRAVPLARQQWFVLVCPPVGLATADVYRTLTVPAQPQSGASILVALGRGDPEEIGRRLHNRLQPVAEALCPRIGEEYARLAALRPAGQLMSGSGSSLFALCRDRREAQRLAQELRQSADGQERTRIYLVRSCS